jgi:hypothetical protein
MIFDASARALTPRTATINKRAAEAAFMRGRFYLTRCIKSITRRVAPPAIPRYLIEKKGQATCHFWGEGPCRSLGSR